MKELRVYLIDNSDIDVDNNALTDEEFITISEEQGNVYTLDKFAADFNSEELSMSSCFIRFIEAEIPIEEKQDAQYLLLGEDACRVLEDEGEKRFLEIVSEDPCPISYGITETTDNPIQLLNDFIGWGDYQLISESLYNKLKLINR